MSANNDINNNLDQIIRTALKTREVYVPADFASKIQARLRQYEIARERTAIRRELAAYVTIMIATICLSAILAYFISPSLIESIQTHTASIITGMHNILPQLKYYIVCTIALLCAGFVFSNTALD